MTAEAIRAERAKVVDRHGPWTAHDIDLGHGVSTMDKGLHQQWRVDWFSQLILQFGASPRIRKIGSIFERIGLSRLYRAEIMKHKHILDLACLEGLFTIEFARMGARTTGLEIRDVHLAKAEFARRTIGLKNCRFVQGDVREIPTKLGRFNVIICAGILYHLDFPDCVTFIQHMARRSDDLVIIDSHFAYDDITDSVLPLTEMRTYEFNGKTYRGRAIIEHAQHVTAEEKATQHVWASLDNEISVWLDERDVIKIMKEEGFDLAHKAFPNPDYQRTNPDRPTLVFKRSRT
jgi:ubiquinone/menaquinone biosynthesis C-methylase UbiE